MESKRLTDTSNQMKVKKKHRFLKFILVVVVLIVTYKGVKHGCNFLAENEMNKFTTNYPFVFANEGDSVFCLTGNFTVPVTYEYDGKTRSVSWSSNSSCISVNSAGEASVTRPDNGAKKVTLTETYKKFIGSAQRKFEVTVIPQTSAQPDSFKVVDKQAVIDGSYNREMELQLNDDGSVRYMYGDFGKTYIYSGDDAVALVNAYKENLRINPLLEISFIKDSYTQDTALYTLSAGYNGTVIEGNSVHVTVDRNTFEVIKITNNITVDVNTISAGPGASDTRQILVDYIGTDKGDYIISDNGTVIGNNEYCQKYLVIFENGGSYTAYVSKDTGEIIYYDSNAKMASPVKVECSGYTEEGEKITFDASYEETLLSGKYLLSDIERNIQALENDGYWEFYKKQIEKGEDAGVGDIFLGTIDYTLSESSNNQIKSDTPEFDNSVAVQTYKNMQIAYDWYKDVLGIHSYDNNGAAIEILVNYGPKIDNACWDNSVKCFMVGPSQELKYSVAKDTEVVAHEYTHAVFSELANLSIYEGNEVCGINEGYADVFACLISGTDTWRIIENVKADTGETVYARDIIEFNGEHVSGEYSETYHDEIWERCDGEEHAISIIISHVGYQMWASDLFTDEDVAKIWYDSLLAGYSDTSTYVDARKNLINSTDKLGYGKECMDFIAYQFDLLEVYDDSYEITTEQYMNNREDAEDDSVYSTFSNAVDGDLILDDSETKTFIIAWSTFGSWYGDSPVFIFEESTGASKKEIEENERILNERLVAYFSDTNDLTNIVIDYRQVSSWQMEIIEKFLINAEDQLKTIAYDGIGATDEDEDVGIIETVLQLAFSWESVKSTAYEFYDGLGLIE